MICIVLAAGYATRLYPLTENMPKPLLSVRGKAILDWLLEDIDATEAVSRYLVVSNHKYISRFEAWASQRRYCAPVSVLDDGSVSNETRLGAVRDIRFAMDALEVPEDLLVVAGDTVLDFSLSLFTRYARAKGTSCVMRYRQQSRARLQKSGVLLADADDRVLRMEEKPKIPFSDWCAPPFYHYTKADFERIGHGIDSGIETDAPGSLAAWLSEQTKVHAMKMPGRRYDIGDIKSYQAARKSYPGILFR